MVPGSPSSHGITAVSADIRQMVADPALSLKFQSSKIDVAKSGDLGYTQGIYTMTMTDPASKAIIHDHGTYVTTYRKQPDGTWKAVADIATSEVPPPMPAPTSKRSKGKGAPPQHKKSKHH
jgi:ketosteroid isomerase-like protein